MNRKNNRVISAILVLTMVFQLAGCSLFSKKISGNPAEIMSRLQTSINELDKDKILNLLMVEKGSSRYKEYEADLDLSVYEDDAVKCYRAVASGIKIEYDDKDIEIAGGIAKVRATFTIPDWKRPFRDISPRDVDVVISIMNQQKPEEVQLTLRLIETKDGLKIKNADELMDIFEFVGWRIAILEQEPDETRPETKPSETEPSETRPSWTLPTETDPKETTPRETEPAPSETEPSESEPSSRQTTPGGSREDLAAAYEEYSAILKSNKDGISWFENNVSVNSCGLADLNSDGVPELYFFSKSASNDKFINFCIYSYLPSKRAVAKLLSTSLTEADSKVSEFFVIRDSYGNIVTYKGFIDEKNTISYYNTYEYNDVTSTLGYSGFLIAGLTGGDKEKAVCSVNGFDNYTSNTSITYDEFLKIEKEMIEKADIYFSGKFISSPRSSASELLENKKPDAVSYDSVMKEIGG